MLGFAWSLGLAAAMAATAENPSLFRVRIAQKTLAASVSRALEGASTRLARDSCAAIFSDFADSSGQPLQANLARLATSGSGYLALIAFHDGKDDRRCFRSRTFAFTFPGSRVVWVCPQFASEQRLDPGFGEVTLIHEALHSLGLGEDPPSAAEITSRVVARCGR